MKGEKVLRAITGIEGYVGLRREGDVIRVSRKSGVSAERIKRDPAFKRCRENAQDFARVAGYGKLLRAALGGLWVRGADTSLSGRMTKALMQAVLLDKENNRGERRIGNGNVRMLVGFEVNSKCPLTDTLKGTMGTLIEADTAYAGVLIQPFVPTEALRWPEGATHYRLKVLGAAMDFESRWHYWDEAEGAMLGINDVCTEQTVLKVQVNGGSGLPLLLVMAVQFFTSDGGRVGNGKFDAVGIIDVGVRKI
jgi:hypothetical protein